MRCLPLHVSVLVLSACRCRQDQAPPPPPSPAKHALLIVLDTLRGDVVAEVDTPVLDRLAAEGASVPRAWSAGTWTVPSTFSLLSGQPVRQHGWDLPTGRIGRYTPLPEDDTLATVLEQAGFATYALYANPYLAEELGFERGFATWRRSVDNAIPEQFADHVARDWGDGLRHFTYLHFIGAHSPLRPSDEARARHGLSDEWFDGRKGMNIGAAKRNKPVGAREAYASAYRAVAEDLDAKVGTTLEALGQHRADTMVVVVSDHGELLGDHNIVGHGTWVWEGLTHVPLIVDHPGVPGDRETLPDTLGIASVPALITEGLGVDHTWPVAADAAVPMVSQRQGRLAFSADGRTKGIWDDKGELSVYDLDADPGELQPGADDGSLVKAKAAWEAATPTGDLAHLEEVELPASTQEDLKALGYLAPEDDESEE